MRQQLYIPFAFLLIIALILTACGAEPEADTPEPATPTAALRGEEGGQEGGEEGSGGGGEGAPTEGAPPVTGGAGVSDLGFRTETNAFSFENYGNDSVAQNLTPAELQRMFGDQVCASKEGGQCVLTPPAAQWMEEINGAMNGGHCEGMAVLSLLMFTDAIKETQFGGNNAADLKLADNEALQREIAYWWATQTVAPTQSSVIKGTPSEILDVLLQMKPGGETYSIGIYKRDGSGGHAITPFGVQDKGNGVYDVLVYDNNYPSQTRTLTVDRNQNTWSYEASINPQVQSELYEGDAETKTLDLTPSSARLQLQACPFCEGAATSKAGGAGLAAQAPRYNEIFLDGDGHLIIVDEQDHRLGYVDGKFVNEIPGAKIVQLKTADPLKDDPEPAYWLPQDINTVITIDGSALKEESLTDLILVGPGYTFGVEGILLEPGQKDTAYFLPQDGLLSYETVQSESPYIIAGVEEPAADFYFEIQGADMEGGGTINILLDTKAGDFIVNAEKLKGEGKFNLVLSRYDDESTQEFYADDIALKAGAVLYVNYAEWKGDGSELLIGVDVDGNGTVDDEYTVGDEAQ